MPFTLKIIFYGLIAFVPDSEKQGLTAVVLDAKAVGLSSHTSKLVVYKGDYKSGTMAPWTLAQSSLEFDPLPKLNRGEGMKGLSFPAQPKGFPNPQQDDYKSLKWIPQMADIEFAASGIKKACLQKTATDCPLVARARIKGRGAVYACHFLHTDDEIKKFVFAPEYEPALPDNARAVADAIEVDFDIKEDFLDIKETILPSWLPGKMLRLLPKDGEIILIISNQPDHPEHETAQHFLGYYKASRARKPQIKGDRYHRGVGGKKETDYFGICEDVLKVYVPHNKAECDAVLFLPEKDTY